MTFKEAVAYLVRAIPAGRVMTYGQVAAIIGYPRAARMVGGVLAEAGDPGDFPWWRVINRLGRVSTPVADGTADRQIRHLRREGILIDDAGQLFLPAYQWWPPAGVEQAIQLEVESARRLDVAK